MFTKKSLIKVLDLLQLPITVNDVVCYDPSVNKIGLVSTKPRLKIPFKYIESISDDRMYFKVNRYWMGDTPTRYDFAGQILQDFMIDGQTKMGPWALMSVKTWSQVGTDIYHLYYLADKLWYRVGLRTGVENVVGRNLAGIVNSRRSSGTNSKVPGNRPGKRIAD